MSQDSVFFLQKVLDDCRTILLVDAETKMPMDPLPSDVTVIGVLESEEMRRLWYLWRFADLRHGRLAASLAMAKQEASEIPNVGTREKELRKIEDQLSESWMYKHAVAQLFATCLNVQFPDLLEIEGNVGATVFQGYQVGIYQV